MITVGLFQEISYYINEIYSKWDFVDIYNDIITSDVSSLKDGINKTSITQASKNISTLYDLNNKSITAMKLVDALIRHVEHHYDTDINSFISDNGIKVHQTFADICELTGSTIESGNIL